MTTAPARPLPEIDEDNAELWESCRRHELRLQRCGDCGAWRYYPTPVCPACASLEMSWERVGGAGTVYAYSVVHRPPSPAFAAAVPYVYALVALAEGPVMPTNIVDVAPAHVTIDMEVELTYVDVTSEVTLPVFRPARGSDPVSLSSDC